MPTVPRIIRRIETEPTPAVNIPAGETGLQIPFTRDPERVGGVSLSGGRPVRFGELAGPGQPIMPDVETVNRSLNAALRIAREEKKKIDHAIATEMDLELYDQGTKLLNEIRQKYRGGDAAGAEDEFLQRWRDIAEGIRMKYVKNPELADAYNRAGSHYTKSFLGSVRAHTSKELEGYELLQHENKISNRIDQAIKNPAITEAMVLDLTGEIVRFGQERGLGEDWIQNRIRTSVGTIRMGVIDQLLSEGDYENAQRYFNKYRDEIDADKAFQLGKIIKTQSDFQSAVDAANNIFNANPGDSLENNMKRLYEVSKGRGKAFFETARTELYGNHARRDDRIKEEKRIARDRVYSYLLRSYEANRGKIKLSDVPKDVWKDYETKDPESALELKSNLMKMAEQGYKLTEEQKILQSINWGRLAGNQELLNKADLESMLLKRDISREQFEGLIKQRYKYDPSKSETIKMILQKINKFKFDTDTNKNLQEQVYYMDLFMRYVSNNYDNPDFDPIGFWDRIASVKERSIVEKIIDSLSIGQPSIELRRLQLEKEAGPKVKPPIKGARQAPDGKWYIPDPDRPGKYLRVN